MSWDAKEGNFLFNCYVNIIAKLMSIHLRVFLFLNFLFICMERRGGLWQSLLLSWGALLTIRSDRLSSNKTFWESCSEPHGRALLTAAPVTDITAQRETTGGSAARGRHQNKPSSSLSPGTRAAVWFWHNYNGYFLKHILNMPNHEILINNFSWKHYVLLKIIVMFSRKNIN